MLLISHNCFCELCFDIELKINNMREIITVKILARPIVRRPNSMKEYEIKYFFNPRIKKE